MGNSASAIIDTAWGFLLTLSTTYVLCKTIKHRRQKTTHNEVALVQNHGEQLPPINIHYNPLSQFNTQYSQSQYDLYKTRYEEQYRRLFEKQYKERLMKYNQQRAQERLEQARYKEQLAKAFKDKKQRKGLTRQPRRKERVVASGNRKAESEGTSLTASTTEESTGGF